MKEFKPKTELSKFIEKSGLNIKIFFSFNSKMPKYSVSKIKSSDNFSFNTLTSSDISFRDFLYDIFLS